MTLNGFVAIPRSVLSEAWYRQAPPLARALWLHLALTVNFAPSTTSTGLALKPGQTVTSWRALAEALSYFDGEKHRTETPTPAKVRRAAGLLRNAGALTWTATGRPTYTGIVVTLEPWPLQANEDGASTDPEADAAGGRLSEPRKHRNNTTGSVDPDERRTAIAVMSEYRKSLERVKRDAIELQEVRRREREGPTTPPHLSLRDEADPRRP